MIAAFWPSATPRAHPGDSGPNWLDSDRYEIVAKAEQPVGDGVLMAMLQTSLAERFKLAIDGERKTVDPRRHSCRRFLGFKIAMVRKRNQDLVAQAFLPVFRPPFGPKPPPRGALSSSYWPAFPST